MDLLVYSLECQGGAEAMAADEVLLQRAQNGVPLLRFYTWSEPTVSLGYFQLSQLLLDNPQLNSLPWVRRQTGGEALVHHLELTYCLVVPTALAGSRPAIWQTRMHQAILEGLQDLGHGLGTMDLPELRLDPSGLLCFLHHTPMDLVFKNHKVAGSAQRKTRHGLMQHGGILLGRSPHAPTLPGVRELSGKDILPGELAAAMCKRFCAQLGWKETPASWAAEEKSKVKELAREKYGSEEWGRKR
ncbi:MAG: lipoate--protein ligase family protein [Gemmataceae bacterium]|nr:lipoate--protein ligase family protein [Gemmataceae bacterium]